MSNVLRARAVLPNGAIVAFCDQLCADRWFGGTVTCLHGVKFSDAPVPIKDVCMHCAWCGEAVAVPINCLFHDGDCPDFDTFASVKAQVVVKRLQTLVGGPLSPRAFDYLHRAGEACRMAGVELKVETLVERMLDVRLDWA